MKITLVATVKHDDNHPGARPLNQPEPDTVARLLAEELKGQLDAIFVLNEDDVEHRYEIEDISHVKVEE